MTSVSKLHGTCWFYLRIVKATTYKRGEKSPLTGAKRPVKGRNNVQWAKRQRGETSINRFQYLWFLVIDFVFFCSLLSLRFPADHVVHNGSENECFVVI